MSGLNQQFAKLSYLITGTGGSNPPLSARQSNKSLNRLVRFFLCQKITESFGRFISRLEKLLLLSLNVCFFVIYSYELTMIF